MKPINAFTWNDYESRIDKMWKPVGVHKLAEGDCQSPVTILPGHLAESLRWRKVGEEEPTQTPDGTTWQDGVKYNVEGYGACIFRRYDHMPSRWENKWEVSIDIWADDLYRPAIAGLDYVGGEV